MTEDKTFTWKRNFSFEPIDWEALKQEEQNDKICLFKEEGQKLCDRYGQMYNCRIEIKDFDDLFDEYEFVEDFLEALEEELKYYVTH